MAEPAAVPNLTATDVQGMQSALVSMTDTVDSERTSLTGVENTIANLMTTWTGSAAPQFAQALNNWEQICARILQAMEQMIATMGQNMTTIAQTEDNASQSAGQLASGLAL